MSFEGFQDFAPPIQQNELLRGLPSLLRPSPTDLQGQSFFPIKERKVTSGFGPRKSPTPGASSYHQGVDLAGPLGETIKSAMNGIVSFAGKLKGYGNVVKVNHGNGIEALYAHTG